MSKDKDGNAIQFVTLVDCGAYKLDLDGAVRERLGLLQRCRVAAHARSPSLPSYQRVLCPHRPRQGVDARHRVADPGAEVSHAQRSTRCR